MWNPLMWGLRNSSRRHHPSNLCSLLLSTATSVYHETKPQCTQIPLAFCPGVCVVLAGKAAEYSLVISPDKRGIKINSNRSCEVIPAFHNDFVFKVSNMISWPIYSGTLCHSLPSLLQISGPANDLLSSWPGHHDVNIATCLAYRGDDFILLIVELRLESSSVRNIVRVAFSS